MSANFALCTCNTEQLITVMVINGDSEAVKKDELEKRKRRRKRKKTGWLTRRGAKSTCFLSMFICI